MEIENLLVVIDLLVNKVFELGLGGKMLDGRCGRDNPGLLPSNPIMLGADKVVDE